MMGDGGSYFLGSFLALTSILGLSYDYQGVMLDNIALGQIEVFPIHKAILIFLFP